MNLFIEFLVFGGSNTKEPKSNIFIVYYFENVLEEDCRPSLVFNKDIHVS